MERGDLLKVNGGIFGPQGQAINDHAASDVRVLVVGNPCNTNCLIARSHAPDVPADRWFAMTRLDENRAKAQLAKKAGVLVQGRHATSPSGATTPPRSSPTSPTPRSAASPRPRSSATRTGSSRSSSRRSRSAAPPSSRPAARARRPAPAHAAIDSVQQRRGSRRPGDDWHSLAVASTGEYGTPEGLQFGYPVRSDGTSWSVVEGIEHDDFAKERIKITTDELVAERDEVRSLGLIPT